MNGVLQAKMEATRLGMIFASKYRWDKIHVEFDCQEAINALQGIDLVARWEVTAIITYGSCCVDEVGPSYVDDDFVVHYSHGCLSY